MRITKYKSIFFDLDDTLWDTYHNNKECLEEIYEIYDFGNYYKSFDSFFELYMPYNYMLWEKYRNNEIDRNTLIIDRLMHFMSPMGITDKDYILKVNSDFLQRTTHKNKLIDGAIDILEYLHHNYKLYIISNGFREIQALKMKNSGIYDYFNKIILSEDVSIQKPNKKIFDYALKTTNSRRTQSIMIGDSLEADIIGAQNADIDQLWFNPYNIELKDNTPPTFEVKTLYEIMEIL